MSRTSCRRRTGSPWSPSGRARLPRWPSRPIPGAEVRRPLRGEEPLILDRGNDRLEAETRDPGGQGRRRIRRVGLLHDDVTAPAGRTGDVPLGGRLAPSQMPPPGERRELIACEVPVGADAARMLGACLDGIGARLLDHGPSLVGLGFRGGLGAVLRWRISAGSSMDRASDYGSEGWGFDSLPAR